ncbi:chromate efflux transporter [Porticoccus sp.]
MEPIANETKNRFEHISFKEAFLYWLKLGFISFGGPAGQISMMHQELVEKRRWISEHRFLHALNYTMVLPGPEAQQLATYIGWLMHGVLGGITAGVLFVLPSLFILMALTWIYLAYGDVPAVEGVLYGIKPAVTAIVVFAAYRIGSRTLKNNVLRAMAISAFVAIFALDVPFPYIVLMAGLIGYMGAYLAPKYFKASGQHTASGKGLGPALIDDDTPVPEHAKFKWVRLITLGAIGFAIWVVALALLVASFGWEGTLTQMSLFFTKAALLTFGGAYAVLPYVYQGGVEHYAWLSGTQMIDGLALGETTPGPLIMVVAFVGFVGGWTKEIFGPEILPFAGAAGAGVATLFTFLPSFLFILLGGPVVEATRHDIKFTAPLTGITAAVVGVILPRYPRLVDTLYS